MEGSRWEEEAGEREGVHIDIDNDAVDRVIISLR